MLHQHGFEVHAAAHNNLESKPGLKLDFVDRLIEVPFVRSVSDPKNAAAYRAIKKVIDSDDYEVIHCNTPIASVLTRLAARGARKRGTKVFYTAHGFQVFTGSSKKDWLIYYPASAFYHFAMQAVERYEADDRIAGISLYNMPQNQTAVLPFSPIASPYDTFFMQLAQSWGQVWMKRQWQAFVDWYAAHSEPFKSCPGVPDNVCRWPESSWLKYHIRYCIEQDKLFVYPYQSLTTCFSDAGSHTARKSNVLQVALQQRAKTRYAFPEPEEAVIYDAWSENTRLAEVLKLPAEELCVDLYGKKRNRQKRRYILTMESLPYQVLQSFALELTPMEANVICNLRGKDIFLYDTAKPAQRPAVQDPDLRFWSFYNRIIYPDPIIRKLAKPIEREIWKNRLKTLSKPKWLLRKLKHRLKH